MRARIQFDEVSKVFHRHTGQKLIRHHFRDWFRRDVEHEDRAAPGRDLLRRLVLAPRQLREMRRLDALQPEGAGEHRRERDDEENEEEPDPAICLALANGRGHQPFFPRSM